MFSSANQYLVFANVLKHSVLHMSNFTCVMSPTKLKRIPHVCKMSPVTNQSHHFQNTGDSPLSTKRD